MKLAITQSIGPPDARDFLRACLDGSLWARRG